MKIKLFIVTFLISFNGFSQSNTNFNWESDIEFIRTELPKNHKNLFFKKDKEYFDGTLDEISNEIGTDNNLDIALKLQQLIASMGDSHTSLNWRPLINRNKILPIKLYQFSDGLFIIKSSKKYKELRGKRITKINGYLISTVIDSLSTLISVDNKAIIKNRIPRLIPNSELLEFFGFVDNEEYIIEVESLEGNKTKIEIIPKKVERNELELVKFDSIAGCWKNLMKPFAETYVEKDSIYYIQYNKSVSKFLLYLTGNWKWAKKVPSFSKFRRKVFKTIKKRNIEKLVFDMRFNNGGSSFQGTKFVKKISKVEQINKKGKLYVVIGRSTFSAAIINTIDFKKLTNAIIIGERTEGKPNHYGEVKKKILPSSNLRLYYSTEYFNLTESNDETIIPDIEIETSYKDYINGIDPIYEYIKNHKL